MIHFFICSYFEGHWIINTKKKPQKQNPTFLRVEYYLIRERPTSGFWSQTSVRADVHTCEMRWCLVLPPPTCTPLQRDQKRSLGQTFHFLAGPSFPAGTLGGVHRSACRLLPFPSAFLLGPPSPPLVLASSFSISSCFQPQTLIRLQINPLQTLRQYNSFQKMIREESLLWKGTFISSLTKWPAIYFSLILPISHFTSNQVRPWFGSTQHHLRPMYPFFFLPSSLCRISHRSNLKGNPGLIWLKQS